MTDDAGIEKYAFAVCMSHFHDVKCSLSNNGSVGKVLNNYMIVFRILHHTRDMTGHILYIFTDVLQGGTMCEVIAECSGTKVSSMYSGGGGEEDAMHVRIKAYKFAFLCMMAARSHAELHAEYLFDCQNIPRH